MSTPEPVPAMPAQVSAGLVDTPAGQRLAVTLTLLLDADGAKAWADAVSKAADSMSASGLITVGGVLNGGRL